MIQTTYTSNCKSIISIKTYSTFTNYSNERYPFNYCSCCCIFLNNSCKLLVPTTANPSYCVYGLRQSSLIHCPPSRRLVLGSNDPRFVAQSSNYNVSRSYCGCSKERVDRIARKSCVCGEKSVDCDRIKSGVVRPKRDFRSNAVGDAEAMLSLLSEGMVREGKRGNLVSMPDGVVGRVEGRKPNGVVGRVEGRKPDGGSGCMGSEPKDSRLELYRDPSREEGPKRDEGRENVEKDEDWRSRRREPRSKPSVVSEKLKDRKQNLDSGYRESEPKNPRLETFRVPSREVGLKKEEERENYPKTVEPSLKRRESSSSYYSLSDSEDFESDAEVESKQEELVGESLVSHEKDSRKSGGVVISEKTKKDWERFRGDKNHVSQSSTRNDLTVGGSVLRDWRKKSEKKLTEDSQDTICKSDKSRKDLGSENSQVSKSQESSSMIDSGSKKKFNFQEEQSTSDTKSFGQSSSNTVKDSRASLYSKFSTQHEHSMQENQDVESTSTSWRRSSLGKDSNTAGKFQETGCDYCETCGRSMEEKKTQLNIQHRADRSDVSIDTELNASAGYLSESSRHRYEKSSSLHQSSFEKESRQYGQIHIETGQSNAKRKSQHFHEVESISANDSFTKSNLRATQQTEARLGRLVEKSQTVAEGEPGNRRKEEGMSSSSLQISGKLKNKEHDKVYLETAQADAKRKSQQYSKIMDTGASYLHNTLRSHQQAETQKEEEKKTTTLEATKEVKKVSKESSGKLTKDIQSSKVSQTDIGKSPVHSSNLEINTQSTSDKQVHNEHSYSKLKLKSVEEIVEKRKWIDETVVQSTLQTEVQGSTGHFSEEATTTQPVVPSLSQVEAQNFRGEEATSGQLSVTPPLHQHVNRLSQFPEASSSPVRKDMGRNTKDGSNTAQKHAQTSSPSFYGEFNLSGGTSSYSPEDALVSAAHMQESSSLIVGDFFKKMSHEASFSETSNEKESSITDSKHQVITQLDPQDALNSAVHMQDSSSLIFGEFAEKMSQETSKSETNIEKKTSKVDPKHQDKKFMLIGLTQSDFNMTGSRKHSSARSSVASTPDSGKTKSPKLDSKRSSRDSGTKEPSDQMWDVKDHFVQESSETEPLEGATSESTVDVRGGKSLWNTVTGALRLRWGSRSETPPVKRQNSSSESQESPVKRQSSPSKSHEFPVQRQSSPSESQKSSVKRQISPSESQKSRVKRQISPSRSGSGETWSSENDANGSNGDGMKSEEISLLQETASNQSLLGTTRSRKEEDVTMSFDGQSSHVDVGASSSSSVLQSSSPLEVAFVGENINLNVTQQLSQSSALVELSPSRKLRRSNAFEEDDGAEKIEAPTSSSDEQKDSSADARQTDDSASGRTDVDLKRRKLQRSKVVIQRYDDWEDAYRREREQRKVDEIFMREALSEAIKAADSWEVPVGAVLVQNGKIIARGYNLVEELRDSTAHAEMLCIKEASNILRTWRLSETTLYVTLEPCPMCAGAILQARISALVWGAPNKLLGADGSWIRLFPAGVEGEESSEVTDKPAAPVHPFHPNMNIRRGILEDECADIMQQFFQLRRRKAKEKKAETSSSEESVQPSCFPKPHHRPKLLHKMHNVFHPSKQRSD